MAGSPPAPDSPLPLADDGDEGDGAGHGGAANRARALSTTAWSGTNGRLAEGEAAGARRGSWSRPPRSLRRRATVGEGRAESGPSKNRPSVPYPGDLPPLSGLSLWEAAEAPGPLGVDLHPGRSQRGPSLSSPTECVPSPSLPVPLSADPPPAGFPPPGPSFPPPPCPLCTGLPSPLPLCTDPPSQSPSDSLPTRVLMLALLSDTPNSSVSSLCCK